MKKLESIKSRDEKVESLLMEKWGYSAPTLNEGGDKELLQEGFGVAALIVSGIIAAGTGVYSYYQSGKTKEANAQAIELIRNVSPETIQDAERKADKVLNFTAEGVGINDDFTWENTILGAEATSEEKVAIERTLRQQLGDSVFESQLQALDVHFTHAPGYNTLKKRGIPLLIDIDNHYRIKDEGSIDPPEFTDDQIKRQEERLDALSDTPSLAIAATRDEEQMGAEIAGDKTETGEELSAKELETIDIEVLSDPERPNSPFNESVSTKTTKDIVREEIVRYLSNRRKK